MPKKIVWDQIEKAPKYKGCKVSITLDYLAKNKDLFKKKVELYILFFKNKPLIPKNKFSQMATIYKY